MEALITSANTPAMGPRPGTRGQRKQPGKKVNKGGAKKPLSGRHQDRPPKEAATEEGSQPIHETVTLKRLDKGASKVGGLINISGRKAELDTPVPLSGAAYMSVERIDTPEIVAERRVSTRRKGQRVNLDESSRATPGKLRKAATGQGSTTNSESRTPFREGLPQGSSGKAPGDSAPEPCGSTSTSAGTLTELGLTSGRVSSAGKRTRIAFEASLSAIGPEEHAPVHSPKRQKVISRSRKCQAASPARGVETGKTVKQLSGLGTIPGTSGYSTSARGSRRLVETAQSTRNTHDGSLRRANMAARKAKWIPQPDVSALGSTPEGQPQTPPQKSQMRLQTRMRSITSGQLEDENIAEEELNLFSSPERGSSGKSLLMHRPEIRSHQKPHVSSTDFGLGVKEAERNHSGEHDLGAESRKPQVMGQFDNAHRSDGTLTGVVGRGVVEEVRTRQVSIEGSPGSSGIQPEKGGQEYTRRSPSLGIHREATPESLDPAPASSRVEG